jgi:DNA-binding SARP family transcriptional activator
VLEFRILGPLEVVGDRGSVDLRGPKQRATLAILLLNAGRVVSVDRLADDLYAGAPPVTAVKQVQRQVSDLRQTLGRSAPLETRSPGYVLRLAPGQLDLDAFERLTDEASDAVAEGDLRRASALLREALTLWRGAPLADLTYEPFARPSIERLEEIRLAALEQRIDADLALGRHSELVGELEELVLAHPLRERFRAQLMLALYRSGRQADALAAYRRAREALVTDFGIEPTPALQELERGILLQDAALDLRQAPALPDRAVLVAPSTEAGVHGLPALAEPLATLPGRELIIARLVSDEASLAAAVSAVNSRRAGLSVTARAAAFTSDEPARDVIRLAIEYDVELIIVDGSPESDAVAELLTGSPADVAIVTGPPVEWTAADGVFVPFGGARNDWAALELGAWLASASKRPLRLVGTTADPRRGQRDASRLLANASLAVQRVVGVPSEPLLAEPNEDALVAAVERATLVVAGISSRRQREGIGAARRALVRDARPPVVLVHAGPRPGGLAPRETRTRFSWSIEPG